MILLILFYIVSVKHMYDKVSDLYIFLNGNPNHLEEGSRNYVRLYRFLLKEGSRDYSNHLVVDGSLILRR